MGAWARDRSLALVFFGAFLVALLAQLGLQWLEVVDEARSHGEEIGFWSRRFWAAFGASTLENWQSEFLQVGAFATAAAYFVYKGSSESPDGDERMEAKLDAVLAHLGLDAEAIEQGLPEKHRRAR